VSVIELPWGRGPVTQKTESVSHKSHANQQKNSERSSEKMRAIFARLHAFLDSGVTAHLLMNHVEKATQDSPAEVAADIQELRNYLIQDKEISKEKKLALSHSLLNTYYCLFSMQNEKPLYQSYLGKEIQLGKEDERLSKYYTALVIDQKEKITQQAEPRQPDSVPEQKREDTSASADQTPPKKLTAMQESLIAAGFSLDKPLPLLPPEKNGCFPIDVKKFPVIRNRYEVKEAWAYLREAFKKLDVRTEEEKNPNNYLPREHISHMREEIDYITVLLQGKKDQVIIKQFLLLSGWPLIETLLQKQEKKDLRRLLRLEKAMREYIEWLREIGIVE
jgi:hypothetical protein